jgi:hypothetical protein
VEEEAGIGGWVFGECVSLICGLVLEGGRERERERERDREREIERERERERERESVCVCVCVSTQTAQQREGHGVFFAYPLTFVSLISRKTKKQRKKKGRAGMEFVCE